MFALPPSASEMDDLQSLSDAIDFLCEALDSDRDILIGTLTDIVRRRAEFEDLKSSLDSSAQR